MGRLVEIIKSWDIASYICLEGSDDGKQHQQAATEIAMLHISVFLFVVNLNVLSHIYPHSQVDSFQNFYQQIHILPKKRIAGEAASYTALLVPRFLHFECFFTINRWITAVSSQPCRLDAWVHSPTRNGLPALLVPVIDTPWLSSLDDDPPRPSYPSGVTSPLQWCKDKPFSPGGMTKLMDNGFCSSSNLELPLLKDIPHLHLLLAATYPTPA